jgi:hypothetical protein
MRTNLSQVLRYLQSGTQVDRKLFPWLSEDAVVKIILHLIKCLPPTENDEQNSNVEQNTTGLQVLSKINFLTQMIQSHYKIILSWHLMDC